jgi:hypothetical protein
MNDTKNIFSGYEEYRKNKFDQKKIDVAVANITKPNLARFHFSGRSYAQKVIGKAVKNGSIQHPSEFRCVDCNFIATEYEHRDYNYPFNVDPICRICNAKRGIAKPVTNYVQVMISLGFVPYVYKAHMVSLARIFNYEIKNIDLIPKMLTVEHWKIFWPELCEKKAA